MNVINGNLSDRNACGWLARWRSVVVILLNDDTVFVDVGKRDVLVDDVRDGTRGTFDGLNANTVIRVANGRA